MALTPRIPAAIADAGMEAMFGGTIADAGTIEIWDDSGTQPAAGGGSSGTSVLLAVLTLNATAWTTTSTNGVLTAAAITQDSDCNATGTALWCRVKTAGGDVLIDGSVGVGSSFNLNVNSTAVTEHGIFAANSLTITHPLL